MAAAPVKKSIVAAAKVIQPVVAQQNDPAQMSNMVQDLVAEAMKNGMSLDDATQKVEQAMSYAINEDAPANAPTAVQRAPVSVV